MNADLAREPAGRPEGRPDGKVSLAVRGGVAFLSVNHPPVNAVCASVRQGLAACLAEAAADDRVGAIVIVGQGRTFPAGIDIEDTADDRESPTLAALCLQVENCDKPVIAAIHGTALGGGFELALACHYRVARSDVTFGLPEVTLGVVPSAGASQRLPRIVGAQVALDLIIDGRPISAQKAEVFGLVDRLVSMGLEPTAADFARDLIARGDGPRPTARRRDGLGDPTRYFQAVQTRRKALRDTWNTAAQDAVELVEAALLLPFDAGLAMESALFDMLTGGAKARGLRHAFLAERRTRQVNAIAGATARPIHSVGVIGDGDISRGLTFACLRAGLPVVAIASNEDAMSGIQTDVEAAFSRDVEAGRMPGAQAQSRLARLSVALSYDRLWHTDLVIEAVAEDFDAKRAVFALLGDKTRPNAVLASTTGMFELAALAGAAARPNAVIGLHMADATDENRLIEVVLPAQASPDLAATGFDLARRIGKVPVFVREAPGFLANAVMDACAVAADYLLFDGATVAEIDKALGELGFARGPYQALDHGGLDAAYARRRRQPTLRDPGHRALALLGQFCSAGWFGASSGRGFYHYDEAGKPGGPNADLAHLVEAERQRAGIQPREVARREIELRCILAMANAGARLVESGIASKPSDVDIAAILGVGFPRWHGGPMAVADEIGLPRARALLAEWAESTGLEIWAPSPLFDALIARGVGFDSLKG